MGSGYPNLTYVDFNGKEGFLVIIHIHQGHW